jgi:hypothetical protein
MIRKVEGYFVLTCSFILLLACLFNFMNHIDYFITRKSIDGEIISKKESVDKDGVVLQKKYYDKNKESEKQFRIKVPYSMSDQPQKAQPAKIEVVYSKWLNQHVIKGYKNPFLAVFILDLIGFGFVWAGIQYARSRLKKSPQN